MIAAIDPLRALSAPLEDLLVSGGDARLNLDPVIRQNGYGCRPFPRPEAFTYASSTASTISTRAYAAAATARQNLLRDGAAASFDLAFEAEIASLRASVLRSLGLEGSGCDIVFSPSGTDSQLHALFLARAVLGTPLVSVIAAADETGSGAMCATTGRHFSAVTASGANVTKGEAIAGLAAGVEPLSIPLRDRLGVMRPVEEIDGEITHAIARSIAAKKRVLLYAMDASKFGQRAPSLDCLRWIGAAGGGDVQVVIDAAQTRLGRKRLTWYLEQNFIVLITGSKFFTGAPFSGALLLPPRLVAQCRAIGDVPPGFLEYSTRSDWPLVLSGLRGALPPRANLGQWLRWVSAAEEMRAYFAVPTSFREFALAQFADAVSRLIAAEPCLQPLPLDPRRADDADDEEMSARTVFPFFVRRNGSILPTAQATHLYRAMNDDIAPLLPALLPPMHRLLASRACHIGQPVAVADGRGGTIGALRISASARLVSESWNVDMLIARESLQRSFDQIRAIIEKIRLLARYFDDVAPSYETPQSRPSYRVNAA